MATTKVTNNVLATNAALNNLNAGASIAFTKPVSVSGNFTVDTDTFFVDSTNNRVGIGTTSPNNNLNVALVGSTINKGIEVSHNTGGFARLVNASSDASTMIPMIVGKGVASSHASGLIFNGQTANDSNVAYGVISFSARNNAGTGVVGNSQRAIEFLNYTTSLMAIRGDGNVGIGTTSPTERLTVSGNISASGTVIASNYNPAVNVAAFLAEPTSANLAAAVIDEQGDGRLLFSGAAADIYANSLNARPICSIFEDFLGSFGQGIYTWQDNGTGSTDTGTTGGSGRFFGLARLLTGATSGNNRSRTLYIGATDIANNAVFRAAFAIPSVDDVAITIGFAGGGGFTQLRYNSSTDSGQWTILSGSSSSPQITTFTTETPQAGTFLSGKRYQMQLTRVSSTQVTLLLEIADWNLTNWSTVFSGNITVPTVSATWGMMSPSFSVTTLTNTAKSIIVDWISLYHPNIVR